MELAPIGNRIIVEPQVQETVTQGGIIIPETAKEKPQIGTVVAVGSGTIDTNGNLVPFELKEQDSVLFSKYGGTDIDVDGKEFIVLRECDVLAVVEDD